MSSRQFSIGLSCLLGAFAFVAFAAVDVTTTRGQGQAGQPRAVAARPPAPVVKTGDLMRLFNKPLYTSVKKLMTEEPADEEGWAMIEGGGLQAAEVANLVAIREAPSNDQWYAMAAGLQQGGVALASAAKARDWNATVQAYQGLLQRCNACHQANAPDTAPVLEP